MKIIFLLLPLTLLAQMGPMDFSKDSKVTVQNSILAKVNGKTISMIDVQKKMDMMFYQGYPHLADSAQAKLQFYDMSWKRVLMDMVDHELMIADAVDKEIKLSDGDVRESLEERFGPNIMLTLDKIGLSYDEAWKMVKDDMIVQRMTWFFIHSKAISSVTPNDIKKEYQNYLKDNPPFSEISYRVVTIKNADVNEEIAKEIHQFLSSCQKSPADVAEDLKKFEKDGISIQVSTEFKAKDFELSEMHKKALANVSDRSYSEPTYQISRSDNKKVCRIFYLHDTHDHAAASFASMAPQLKNQLIQKAVAQEYAQYLGKLRQHYGFNPDKLVPEDLHPFTIR